MDSHKHLDFTEDRFQELREELAAYGRLPKNWDLDSGQPPSATTVSSVQSLLALFPQEAPVPRPMLSADGKVGLYWDAPTVYADLEVDQHGMASLFTRRREPAVAETYDELPVNDPTLQQVLASRLKLLFHPA